MQKGIALGGFMGVGKSAVGQELSGSLDLPFHDLDAILEDEFGPISEQFMRDGEDAFRSRESEALLRITGWPVCVLSTGGGTWINPKNQALLKKHFHRVVLSAPLDVIRARIGVGNERPKWNDDVEALFESRRAAYLEADYIIDTSELSVHGVVREIVDWLKLR